MPDEPKVSPEEQKKAEENHKKVADFLKANGLEVKAAINYTRDGIFPQPYVVEADKVKEPVEEPKNPAPGKSPDSSGNKNPKQGA